MFGRDKEHGQATVVAREVDDAASDRYHNGWTYVADVQPDSGAPAFRATFRARFSHTEEFHEPVVGEQIRVTFDKDQQVEFDPEVLREMAKAKKADRKEQFAAIAGAAPGSAVDPASADVQAAQYRAMRIRAAIDRAKEAGNDAEIERLTAMLARVEAGDLSLPAAAPMPDPLDRLQKLADLHESGALTDEEFAAEKAKLLGAS
jgi:Short C-terminal domain